MSEPVRDTLIAANDAFYRAIRDGVFAEMDALWSEERHVTCTHPGAEPISGRGGVLASWRAIIGQMPPPQVWPGEPAVVLSGRTGLVLCIERIGATEMMASNAFIFERAAWRMVNHQATLMPATSAV